MIFSKFKNIHCTLAKNGKEAVELVDERIVKP